MAQVMRIEVVKYEGGDPFVQDGDVTKWGFNEQKIKGDEKRKRLQTLIFYGLLSFFRLFFPATFLMGYLSVKSYRTRGE